MSTRKRPISVTVDPEVLAAVEERLDRGDAASLSAYVNAALAEKVRRERRVHARWAGKVAEGRNDPAVVDKVARMMEHIDKQAAAQ